MKGNYVEKFTSNRTINILCLGYKNQSVSALYGNIRCLFCDPYTTHASKYTVWVECRFCA